MDSTSQATKIYRLIKKNNKYGTSNYDLSKLSLKYSSRITELRHDGHNIYCERVTRNGRATGTFLYYLNDEPELVQRRFKLGFRNKNKEG